MPGWLTATAVAAHAEVKGVTGSSVPLTTAAAAAETWVEGTARPDINWSADPFIIPADVYLGTLMLAWRWFQRRASPLGVVTTPTGDPVEMLRNDPDIARLLGVAGGAEGEFVFGASDPEFFGLPASGIPAGYEIGYDVDGVPYLIGG